MNMKNNKVLVVIIIVLSIFVLVLGGYVIYDKYIVPRLFSDNNNDTVLNEELEDTVLFSIKIEGDNYLLIALDDNGEETTIYNFSDYYRDIENVRYFYDDKDVVIYLSFKSYERDNHREENEKFELALIDLRSSDYELDILTELDVERSYFDKFGDNITKIGNYIYFANSKLYRMDLDNYVISKLDVTSLNRSIDVLNYLDNSLIYNVDDTIYKYDLSNDIKEVIEDDSIIEYIYKDNLVYSTGIHYVYKSYNLSSGKINKISERVGRGTSGFSFVIPYNDSFLSLINDTFYYDNREFKLSCVELNFDVCKNFSIDSYILYKDDLIVSGAINTGPDSLVEEYKAIIVNVNLKYYKIESIDEVDDMYMYRYVTYVK